MKSAAPHTKTTVDIKAGFGFDPEWTQEEALAAGTDGPCSPFFRWAAWHQLEEHQKLYDGGNKVSLFNALCLCARHELPMPDWLGHAYRKGHRRWAAYDAASLDEAFDVQLPKNARINTLRRNRMLRIQIPLMVKDYHNNQNRVIDQSLFEDIGKELGVSGSTARDLYYENKDFLHLQKKR